MRHAFHRPRHHEPRRPRLAGARAESGPAAVSVPRLL